MCVGCDKIKFTTDIRTNDVTLTDLRFVRSTEWPIHIGAARSIQELLTTS